MIVIYGGCGREDRGNSLMEALVAARVEADRPARSARVSKQFILCSELSRLHPRLTSTSGCAQKFAKDCDSTPPTVGMPLPKRGRSRERSASTSDAPCSADYFAQNSLENFRLSFKSASRRPPSPV